MAALTGPVGWAIAALVAAVAVIVISLKIFKSAIKATAAAMNKAMGLQKTAQIAGKTVEQVQAEQMAGMFGGDAEKDFDLFKELGLIIDKELIASLTRSGKTLMAFGIQVANVLIPIFEKLAKVTAGLVKILGGSVLALKATFEPVFAWIADNKIKSMVPAVLAYGIATNMDPAAGIDAFWDYIKKMNKLVRGEFEGAAAGAAAGIAMQTPSDALTRIGLFKGGADSQLQTLKASLAAQRGTELNTTGLISAVTNA